MTFALAVTLRDRSENSRSKRMLAARGGGVGKYLEDSELMWVRRCRRCGESDVHSFFGSPGAAIDPTWRCSGCGHPEFETRHALLGR